jgi:hypothetical protein
MSSPSNLYAEKIFSEHPLALWALDDTVDYVSLISESDRDISLWDSGVDPRSGIFGGTAQVASVLNEPFPDSVTIKLTGNLTDNAYGQIECISPIDIGSNGVLFSEMDQSLGTFSIGSYVYTDSAYLSKIDIGYEYYDSVSGENVQKVRSFTTSISGRWMFVAETFDIPSDNSSLRLILKIEYSGGAESTSNYEFLVNGLSLGQWSEEFASTSLGSAVSDLPTDIAISGKAVQAKSYGLQTLPGYYLCKDSGTLSAKNAGLPMVYGASNTTILSPNGNSPSLVIPGNGFLNEYGKYRDYTFEFWLRLACDSLTEKRIFGPIASTDGIYVRGPFITLKVGNSYGSYFVGEWLRPMLINIKYSSQSAILLINSEVVISLNLSESDIDFPSRENLQGKDQDWLGFYAYEDVPSIELDCIAIYPYQVSQILAKRRWVYGQGVEFPENINTAYSGTSIFIDSSFAKYANTYSYPDLGKWTQGVVDNLVSERDVLSVPTYQTPRVFFNNKTQDEWLASLSEIQSEEKTFLTLRPNSSWNSAQGHILIDNLSSLGKDVKGFYGVFKQKQKNTSKEILFEIEDVSTSNYLQIFIENSLIKYVLSYGSQISEIYSSEVQYVGEEFSVGIDFRQFSEYFGGNLAAFFGKKSSLNIYVGGNKKFQNTFSGNIYAVGISTERNFSKISQFFSQKGLAIDFMDIFGVDGGIPATEYWESLYDGLLPSTTSWETSLNPDNNYLAPSIIATTSFADFTASYTLKLTQSFDKFKLSIASDSYWEDYIPLTYLAKYVNDANGVSHYDLDFIQFNLNYPAPSLFIQEDEPSAWTYEELQEKFYLPVQRTYESLDNQLFTGYENYNDLKNKSFKTYKYDTSNSNVRTYVTFQYLASGANAPQSYFTNTIKPDKNGVVIPGSYIVGYQTNTNHPIYDSFENTRYEVVDNMVIYPPSHVDFNELAMVTHMEIIVDDIETNPIKIKKLQYASHALNDTTANMVGTRFGTDIYPYKKAGIYYDYKSPNPFTIYRGSSPYLYMTRNSGIQLRGNYDPAVNRGINIPINEAKSSEYKVIAMQMAMRYDQDFFPYAPTQIFEIESRGSLIKFYLVSNHPDGKRAKIYAINAKTGRLENGIAFYWNGKIVKEPNITVKEWGMLGVSFSNSLNFERFYGSIRITGPLTVNSISHYKSTNLQEVQQVTNRPWFKVRALGNTEFDWQYWETSYIWNGVLVLSATSYYGVSPDDIYKTYTGTNKIIVDDERPFSLGSYEYRTLSNVLWQANVINAV